MNARLALLSLVLLGSCARSTAEVPSRLLARGATLHALVSSLDGLEAALAHQVEALGGYTTSSTLNGAGDDATLVVSFRVPASNLDAALSQLEARTRRVDSREVRGEDLTEEYVDLDGQRANLVATRGRLRELLEKASTVGDALAVNKGLAEVQGELEKVEGRLKYLRQAAALSTVTATFYAERRTVVSVGDWRPLEVARAALQGLISALQWFASALIVLVVFTPLWAPLAWLFCPKRARPQQRPAM